MRKSVLVVLAVFVLCATSQLLAQAPPVAAPPALGLSAPVPDVADAGAFLATLSAGKDPVTSEGVPTPLFMATGCGTTAECPKGQLCCNVCGNPPLAADISCRACVTPVRGRCPLVV